VYLRANPRCELRQDARQHRRERTELRKQEGVGGRLNVLAQGLAERQIGRHALGVGGCAAPHQRALLRRKRRGGGEQTGLTDPWLAHKEDDPTLPLVRARQLVGNPSKLIATPR